MKGRLREVVNQGSSEPAAEPLAGPDGRFPLPIPAIDAWTNPFTELGIKTIFIENEEVAFSMGEQWGRFENMKWYEPAEFIEEVMDPLGIRSVCMPTLKMMQFRTKRMLADLPEEHLAPLIQKWPDRFVGLVGIDPFSGMKGVKRLEKAVTEYGFRGAHVHPFGFDLAINSREWWPFYTKCAELGIPVEFQAGHSAEFMPSAHGRPILLDDIALWFPELDLVGGHCGWPWSEELIAMAWKHPNVYIGVSGHAPKYWDIKLVHFLNSFGMGKVMWGTDFPLILHRESLNQILDLGLKPEALRFLLHDAAARVFHLGD